MKLNFEMIEKIKNEANSIEHGSIELIFIPGNTVDIITKKRERIELSPDTKKHVIKRVKKLG